jgi:hypothetical protein
MTTEPEKHTLDKEIVPKVEKTASANALEHPLQLALSHFVDRARDIEDCSRFLKTARDQRQSEIKDFLDELKRGVDGFTRWRTTGEGSGLVRFIDVFQKLKRFASSQPDHVMSDSLFLGLFAAFDGFIGDLLRALFQRRAELFNRIGRDIPFKDILLSKSLDDVKLSVLDKFIEEFRRDSYIEQFESGVTPWNWTEKEVKLECRW